MVNGSTLSRVFTAIGNNSNHNQDTGFPMLNSVMSDFSSFLSATGQIRKKKRLMSYYYSTPELTGIVNKVCRDIVSDYEFVPIKKGERGRRDKEKAMEFAEKNNFDRTRFSQVVDSLITGEGFGWIKGLSKAQQKRVKERAISTVLNSSFSLEEKEVMAKKIELKIDEDLRKPKDYLAVASSTMEVRHDQEEIINYMQVVNAKRRVFSTEEIVRFNLMDVDGRVSGFTPIESMITQVEILYEMWQNQLALQKNGGSPDRIIVAKNLQPNSVSYKKIKEQLLKYKHVQNRHGNMLFTGDIDVKNLEQLDQMQFKDSGLYITGLIALQWSVPRSSIPMIIGGTNTKDDTGGNSERDYWNNVEFMQQLWANIENTQFWMDRFNVRIKFKRKFKQTMIQEETHKQLLFNNTKLMNEMFRMNGKTLTNEKMMQIFDINNNDLEEVKMEEEVEDVSSTLNNQMSQDEVNDSDDKKNKNMRKRDEQLAAMSSMSVPTGVGKELVFKEFDDVADLEFKQLLSGDLMRVDFDEFIKLYSEDKQMGVSQPRLFVHMKNEFVNLNYKSTDYTYTTSLSSEEFNSDSVKIKMMNLKGNIYKI